MVKYIIGSLLFFSLYMELGAQPTKLRMMQGIWDYTLNTDTSKYYKIVNGKNCLSFSFTKSNSDSDFTLFEMVIGFQSFVTKYDEVELIHVDSLKENGLYYTEIINRNYITAEGVIDKTFCIIASYHECDGELLSINGGKLFEYGKVMKLPSEGIKRLYNRGKHDNRNYIKDYIGIDVKEIKDARVIIYSTPGTASKVKLLKGELVTIVMRRGEWYKIQFEKNEIIFEGWIMQKRVK
jgi:hypothetical protein